MANLETRKPGNQEARKPGRAVKRRAKLFPESPILFLASWFSDSFSEKSNAGMRHPCHWSDMKPTLFCCLLVCSLGLANIRGQENNKPEEKKSMDTNQKEVA